MSFAVIAFNCSNKSQAETFRRNLEKDFDITEWKPNVFSVETESAKDIMAIKARFNSNKNVKIEWAATEEKILDIIERMCKNTSDVKPTDWR
jgi:hypothetical protein